MRRKIAVLMLGEVLASMAMFNLARGQEHNHEAARVQKEFSDTKDGAAPQAQGMKCCEGMEKMGAVQTLTVKISTNSIRIVVKEHNRSSLGFG